MSNNQVPAGTVPLLSNRTYDILRRVVQVVLPACGALYAGLAALLELPYGIEVVGVIALVATFLGTVLGISEKSYNQSDEKYDGVMTVGTIGDDLDNVPAVQIEFNEPPEVTSQMDQLILKVVR